MTLPQSKIDEINADAEKYFNHPLAWGRTVGISGYIAGATAEALKSLSIEKENKELKQKVSALENVRNVLHKNIRGEMDNHQKVAVLAEQLQQERDRYKEA